MNSDQNESSLSDNHALRRERFLETLSFLTPGMQKKLAEKKLGLKELEILEELDGMEHQFFFEWLEKLRCTRQELAQILDLGGEIFILGHPIEASDLKADAKNAISHLRLLRNPKTMARDEQNEKKLSSLRWPRKSRIQFRRYNDEAFMELTVPISRREDLIRIIRELQNAEKQWKESE